MTNCNEELTKYDYLEDNITNDYISYEKGDKKILLKEKLLIKNFYIFFPFY